MSARPHPSPHRRTPPSPWSPVVPAVPLARFTVGPCRRLFTALSLWCTLRLSPTPLRLRSWARSRARFNGQAPLRLTKLSLPLSWCFVRERREQPEGPNVKPTHDSGVGSRIQPWGFSPPCHFIYFLVGEGGRAIFPKSLRVFRLLVARLCCDQLVVRPYLARARIGRR